MKPYLLAIVIGIVLSSCDPGVSYERIIENNSSYDIWVKTSDNGYPGFTQDSFLISKNSEQVISIYSGSGQTFEFENCGMADSTIYSGIYNNDTLMISINLNGESNWIFSVLNKTFKQGGECECKLKLTDNEIKWKHIAQHSI